MPCSLMSNPDSESPSKGFLYDRLIGSSLLEEWPQNYVAYDCPRKRVTFSEYSEMRIYYNEGYSRSNKSYSYDDRINFQAQVALDASRIRNIISMYPHSERAVHYAIDVGLIKHEELIGIEHLVGEKAATHLIHRRKAHVSSVLMAQEQIQAKYGHAVDPIMLGRVAKMSSSRSVVRARVRAAWSMNDEKLACDSCFQHSMRVKTVKKSNICGAHAA